MDDIEIEKILSQAEAELIFHKLSIKQQTELELDKIRFGEYYIGYCRNGFCRLNPINVILINGQPVLIKPGAATEI